jgi:hypothetical protein
MRLTNWLFNLYRHYLEFVAAKLNNRPRKRLGWKPHPKPSTNYRPTHRIQHVLR